jgi:chemotaxis protein histidine kinase CheA
VIKALDDSLGQNQGIAGATILGDGRVVLIVDVPSLVDRFRIEGFFPTGIPVPDQEVANA